VADKDLIALLKKPLGWDAWRKANPSIRPDLREANLNEADLRGANLGGANLRRANLSEADLRRAKLGGANLRGANLDRADLFDANLQEADLRDANLGGANLDAANLSGANLGGANLIGANLSSADLFDANLSGANLIGASLVGTRLSATNMTGARVYGVSAWDVETDDETEQTGLIITPPGQSAIMVDDLEVAQFIYLLLNRDKIRNVIDTVTRKGVLLLGRFGDGGLVLLQALAAWLRMPENGGYLPLLFDFPRPGSKTYTETIRTLASLARFVIVDLSGPSVPQEITATVDLFGIPFVPILEQKRKDWSMFKDFLLNERVLKPVLFTDQNHLLKLLANEVIAPAEKFIEKRQQLLDEIFRRA
jgi:Pentapeptide repeats (8 copies)